MRHQKPRAVVDDDKYSAQFKMKANRSFMASQHRAQLQHSQMQQPNIYNNNPINVVPKQPELASSFRDSQIDQQEVNLENESDMRDHIMSKSARLHDGPQNPYGLQFGKQASHITQADPATL